jgi:tetratricopeptide (TPR) repeat protein
MSVPKFVWPLLLGLAVAVEIEGAFLEDPPSAGAGAAAGAAAEAAPPTTGPEEGTTDEPPTNLSDFIYTTDEAIQLFELRAKVNPRDHTSLATLGDLYERKARETDDLACFARAEEALRRSLELYPASTRAKVSLAVVLCDRHKFGEALAVAQEVVKAHPKSLDALATVGDAQLELGRYDDAERSLRELVRRLPNSAPALARLAHLEELKGRTDEALRLVRQAIEALRKAGANPESLAWYQFREADILFNAGRADEAGAVAEAVLAAVPGHHDATATLARVRAAQGRNRQAIELFEKAVSIAPDPSMLVALGDLYALEGDDARARANYDRMERATLGQPEHRRVLAVFYADHDRDLPRALELARQDLEQRQDVYGHDALAWALLKNGRVEEAARSMAEALKLGTRDARLYYHAGMIARGVGDSSKARDSLGRSLALNPGFSPRDSGLARRALSELGSPPPAR